MKIDRGLAVAIATLMTACGGEAIREDEGPGVTRDATCSDASRADVPEIDRAVFLDDQARCQLSGCVDGVRVLLRTARDEPIRCFHGSFLVGGVRTNFRCKFECDGQVETGQPLVDCGSASLGRVGIIGVPSCIDLDVISDTDPGSFRGRIVPIYGIDQPNGPGCEPICRSASAGVVLR